MEERRGLLASAGASLLAHLLLLLLAVPSWPQVRVTPHTPLNLAEDSRFEVTYAGPPPSEPSDSQTAAAPPVVERPEPATAQLTLQRETPRHASIVIPATPPPRARDESAFPDRYETPKSPTMAASVVLETPMADPLETPETQMVTPATLSAVPEATRAPDGSDALTAPKREAVPESVTPLEVLMADGNGSGWALPGQPKDLIAATGSAAGPVIAPQEPAHTSGTPSPGGVDMSATKTPHPAPSSAVRRAADSQAAADADAAPASQPPRRVLRREQPAYPSEARRQGWSGRVRLEILVATSGRVVEAKVLESSGFPLLDRAALSAARKWRYEQADAAGTTGPERRIINIIFALD